MKWWHIVSGLVVVVTGFFLVRYILTPAPGIEVSDQGREHVSPEEVAAYTYNSNPPTSGPHLVTWVKPGIYTSPQSEGELIHSLEHGYIIISYNCGVHLNTRRPMPLSVFGTVFAHEGEEEGSPSGDFVAQSIATGSAVNETQGCKTLISQLEDVANSKNIWKLILVPRPQLDTTIAITAWGYVDKFDAFDKKRIERFIDFHRDQGPEKTME